MTPFPQKTFWQRLVEEGILLISLLKWTLLAVITGALVGVSTGIFLKALEWATLLWHKIPHYYLILPITLFGSALLVRYLAPEAEGHGTEKVIEAVHQRAGKIAAMVVPVKTVATIITIASGGSAGKEGPAAQIGAALCSIFANLLRLDDRDRKKLVICGISAGFAAVFGTPMAGAIFGIEVLFLGSILYEVILPSFIAGMVAYHVTASFGVDYFAHPIEVVPPFSGGFFFLVILAGIFCGLCAIVLIELLQWGHRVVRQVPITWTPARALLGGGLLLLLLPLASSRYLGLGLESIQSGLSGEPLPHLAFFFKALFTSITLNFGGSGGIVTPIFFVGTASGNLFAQLTGMDVAAFSAIGLVAVLAGAANTPIAASIMAVELFGPNLAPYAAVACVVSFLITGHRSVYPSQVVASQKSTSIEVEVGQEVVKIHPQVRVRPRSLTHLLLSIVRRSQKKPKKTPEASGLKSPQKPGH